MDEGIVNSTASDEDLMTRYMAGDERAFEVVYRRHREAVRRFLARQSGSVAVGQELGQEVWFRVIRAVQDNRYSADGRFRPYLFRIARNLQIDHFRRQNIRPISDDDGIEGLNDPAPSPAEISHAEDCGERLLNELGELPPEQRDTFLLKEESGLTLEQIAEMVNAGRETIKSRLRYAMKRLRSVLEDCL